MKKVHVNPLSKTKKTIYVPGDKSISHRAIIIGSLAKGLTKVKNLLEAEDTLHTINVYKELGINIEKKKHIFFIRGRGLFAFREPSRMLYVGGSGTTIRLTLGVLAAQNFSSTITGDAQIIKRPMRRVIIPLSKMGAKFDSNNGYAPIKIYGGSLHGITYRLPIPSAQVKSAIMLAAIHADGKTEIIEPYPSRDHTERMLKYFECNIKVKDKKIIITPDGELKAKNITIPGDISSAAYFMVAGLLVKNARITIKNVGLNPTRTGVIDVLKKM